MLETVFDVDGFPGGLGWLVCFRLQVAPKKLRINSTVTIGSDAVFPGRSLFLYRQHVSHGRFQNQIAGWFGSIVPGRFNIFFEYVYPMLGPRGCNHGIFCKNIRISRPSLNSRWWQLKYFFIFTPITWGNDPIWSNLTTVIFFKWVETTT